MPEDQTQEKGVEVDLTLSIHKCSLKVRRPFDRQLHRQTSIDSGCLALETQSEPT